MLWASGATCLSSRFISLDVLASVVRRSSPILSNGIFSILATILLTCCCNWSRLPGTVGMMAGSDILNSTGLAFGKSSSTT
ncbi:hypothetical protein D3C81_2133880 [compost metagenome]